MHPHSFDRAQALDQIVVTPQPAERRSPVALLLVVAISVAFWVSLAHGLATF